MENEDVSALSRKERREFFREQKREEEESKKNRKKIIKLLIMAGVIAVAAVGVWFLVKDWSKPLPGQEVSDLGREHVKDGTKVEYNSDPPTSGSHFSDWTKAGIYDNPISDGHLIHSLEHGYVIISYNCEKVSQVSRVPRVSRVFAHEEDLSSPSASLENEELPDNIWESKECKELKNQLSGIVNKEKLWKLILIPRPNLDASIALTAWTRVDKLDKINEQRIAAFINSFRDRGPEKTIEP